MNEAIVLADKAKGLTFPNPAVGAVIVKHGIIVGRGATDVAGGPHAEKRALAQAGAKAKGGTLYVTLEPCCHFGRTPPCTNAIIDAGIIRVIVSVKDPNPLVAGKGIGQLQRHGIEVLSGLQKAEASRLNEDFFFSIIQKRPWITLKLAMTLDGCIADSHGDSKWITSSAARTYVHELRRKHSAIAVGSGTVKADDPQLTVRHIAGYSPARIIFSSRPLPRKSAIANSTRQVRTIVVMSGGPARSIRKNPAGVETWHTGEVDPVKSMAQFLEMAYSQGITSIFVEGGHQIATFLLEHQLVNRLHIIYGNKILGGGLSGFDFSKSLPLSNAFSLERFESTTIGDNIAITGTILYNQENSRKLSTIQDTK